MRLANVLVTGTLFVAVIAEGAYIIKTHRQIDKLSEQVQQLAADSVEGDLAREQPSGRLVGERPTTATPTQNRPPPPRFNTPPPIFTTPPSAPSASGGPALPPVLDNPEARAQLRQFVAAEMQSQRDEWRQQQIQARDDEARRRLENAIKNLGISESDGRKLTDIVTKGQAQRDALREKIQSGQLPREQVPQAMSALREDTDKQVRALLGDEKAQKFQESQRQNRGPGGGWGQGRGFGGPGMAGGPPPAPP